MPRIRWGALLFAAFLCSCGGGVGAGMTPPSTTAAQTLSPVSAPASSAGTSAAAVNASTRTTDSLKNSFIAVLYPDHFSVYDRSARGLATPTVTHTLPFTASSIATDYSNSIYIADSKSWTVYKYSSAKSATPETTYSVVDSAPDASQYNDSIAAVGVRYDAGIAALLVRSPKNGGPAQYSFGIITPSNGVLRIVAQLTSSVSAGNRSSGNLMVDGSGDVLVETIINYSFPGGNAQPVAVERFSPHRDGFHDDGIIYQNWILGPFMDVGIVDYEAWATSGTDELLARSTLYPTTNNTGVFNPTTGSGTASQETGINLTCPSPFGLPLHAAFDGNNKLYILQGLLFSRNGIYTYGICIFPRKPAATTKPETLTLSETTLPSGIVVSQ
jgi:hypothetical protein